MKPVCKITPAGLTFWCYGCNTLHLIGDDFKNDGDEKNPTVFGESIGLREQYSRKYQFCHFLIFKGHIYYWGDSTHTFKNSIMPLLPMEDWFNNAKKKAIVPDRSFFGWKNGHHVVDYVVQNFKTGDRPNTLPITRATKDMWYEEHGKNSQAVKDRETNKKLETILQAMNPEEVASIVARLNEKLAV